MSDHLPDSGSEERRRPGRRPDDATAPAQRSSARAVEGVPEATLERFGLTRPFGGAAEADHIQLLGRC
jgi:hypothetical protein